MVWGRDGIETEDRNVSFDSRVAQFGKSFDGLIIVQAEQDEVGVAVRKLRGFRHGGNGDQVVLRSLKNRRQTDPVRWQRGNDKKALGHEVEFV